MRMTFALAALLAATAFTPAIAQDNSERPGRGERRAERMAQPADGASRGWQRPQQQTERPQRAEGGWQRGQQQAAPAAPVVQQPQQQAQQNERRWNGGDRGAQRDTGRNQQDGGRSWRRNDAPQAQLGGTPAAPPAIVNRDGRRFDNNQPNRNWNGEARRNDSWRNNGQNAQRRDDNRDGRNDGWRNQQRGNDNRYDNNAYRPDNRNWNGNTNWNNGRSWNRDWRRNQQYDWQRYRTSNRDLYRARPYYAPRGWSYGYQRFSIGYSLSSILFDQRYWIEDPYAYRLPPVDGPYRWVRYYDDVLLVDLRTGEVVDTIHDFFW